MIRIRKDLSRLKALDQLQKMKTAAAGLKTNANFPAPPVIVATLEGKHEDIEDLLGDITAKENALKGLRNTRDELLEASRADYSQNGSYVEAAAGDDRTKALSSGYDLATDAPVPLPPLTQVTNFTLTTGDDTGELDGQYNPVPGADGYEPQCSPDPITANSWENCPAAGKSKFTLTGQPSLTRRWGRVRAFRGDEKGPWSDPAQAIVP